MNSISICKGEDSVMCEPCYSCLDYCLYVDVVRVVLSCIISIQPGLHTLWTMFESDYADISVLICMSFCSITEGRV